MTRALGAALLLGAFVIGGAPASGAAGRVLIIEGAEAAITGAAGADDRLMGALRGGLAAGLKLCRDVVGVPILALEIHVHGSAEGFRRRANAGPEHGGAVMGRRVELAPLVWLDAHGGVPDVARHEVLHVCLAGAMGQPVPAWLAEGWVAAVLAYAGETGAKACAPGLAAAPVTPMEAAARFRAVQTPEAMAAAVAASCRLVAAAWHARKQIGASAWLEAVRALLREVAAEPRGDGSRALGTVAP